MCLIRHVYIYLNCIAWYDNVYTNVIILTWGHINKERPFEVRCNSYV